MREHFGKLYDEIFNKQGEELNGAQVVIAVLLYRFAEQRRKTPPEGAKPFVPYASCFISMQMGKYLLKDIGIQEVSGLNHRNFPQAKDNVEKKNWDYFQTACVDIEQALTQLYGNTQVSAQQLAATFRRGDLITKLEAI